MKFYADLYPGCACEDLEYWCMPAGQTDEWRDVLKVYLTSSQGVEE